MRFSSESDPPPMRTAVWKPSAPSSPASRRRAQLVQRRAVFLRDVLPRRLQQDQVPRALGARGHPRVALPLRGLHAVGGDHHGLARLQALQDRGVEDLLRPVVDLLLRDPPFQQGANLVERQQRHRGSGSSARRSGRARPRTGRRSPAGCPASSAGGPRASGPGSGRRCREGGEDLRRAVDAPTTSPCARPRRS